MSDLRHAAQQALEALQERYAGPLRDRAIEALEAALAGAEPKVWCACGDSIEPDSGAKCGNCVAGDSAEPEQEPVAWAFRYDDGSWHDPSVTKHSRGMLPLYSCAATPQRKPLTDEEIALLVGECAASAHRHDDFSFARSVIAAYEAKNGIGEQT